MTAPTFAPPATYDELRTMLGRDFTMPDGSVQSMSSCGGHGSDFHAGFGWVVSGGCQHAAWTWSPKRGFETFDQTRARHWDASAGKLKANERALIVAVLGDVFAREDRATLKTPEKLVNVAIVKLVKAGKLDTETCSRCGGSGHFSRCEMYGTRCFKCSGSGKQMPTVTKALKAARVCEAV